MQRMTIKMKAPKLKKNIYFLLVRISYFLL
ncbi:unnamed protein product [Acanthoscelides obtectus]|uniref:Uncharacterized protein n=1 Tax=Acanthoscelides obtectus TaxID=200917 RepID=A0A9P0P9R2_ACAOB|nr:unnamed protein product [Acanthoscelides obtectus]CAK1688769.1 hypothetical protein AOBTE_LOCUS36872 [Acanthoscelides obtectus]